MPGAGFRVGAVELRGQEDQGDTQKRIEKRAVKTSNWLAEDINRLEGNPW
jgi:hypothetical protein